MNLKYSAVIGANGQDGFLMTRYLLKKKLIQQPLFTRMMIKYLKLKTQGLKLLESVNLL